MSAVGLPQGISRTKVRLSLEPTSFMGWKSHSERPNVFAACLTGSMHRTQREKFAQLLEALEMDFHVVEVEYIANYLPR